MPDQKENAEANVHTLPFSLLSSFCIMDHTLNNTGHCLLFQLLMQRGISLALPHGFALVSCVHRTGICFIMIQKHPCIFNAHYQMCCTFPLPLLLPPPNGLCLVCRLTVSPVSASVQRFALLRQPDGPNASSPATSAFPPGDSKQRFALNPPFRDLMPQR